MASEIVREYTDDKGRHLREYASGAIQDAETGYLVGNPRTQITTENQREMRQRRQEVTAQRIRAEIAARTGKGVLPTAAVALAAGDLWENVVMNNAAHPRYRLEAWQTIASKAGLIGDSRESAQTPGISIEIGQDIARELIQRLSERRNRP